MKSTGNVTAIAELADRLNPVLRRHGVVRASVFGSLARGESRPDSDLDLLVEYEAGRAVTLFDLSDLRQELKESSGREVDLVFPDRLKPRLRQRILRELVTIL